MNRPLVRVVAAAVLACAALPAFAQPYGPPPPPGAGGGGRGVQLRQRADALEHRIRRGEADGSVDRREGDRALGELGGIRRMEDDLLARGRGNLSPPDRAQISASLDRLESGLHWMRPGSAFAPPPPPRGGFAPPPGGFPPPGGAGHGYGFGRDFWRGAPTSLEQRADWLDARVHRGAEDGSLTRGETARAYAMLRDFRRMWSDLNARDGDRLSASDRARLSMRLDSISQEIHWLQTNDRRY